MASNRALQRVDRFVLGGSSPYARRYLFSLTRREERRSVSHDSDVPSEHVNVTHDLLLKLRERWDNKLVLPLSELRERYLRHNLCIVLDCSLRSLEVVHGERFSLTISKNASDCVRAGSGFEGQIRGSGDDSNLPVFIKPVHIVDDANGVIERVVASLVRLQIPDEAQDVGIFNAAYFSVVTAGVVLRKGFTKNWKLDSVFMRSPVVGTGEAPDDMVKAGAQMMYGLSGQDSKPRRNSEIFMVVNRILPSLFVGVWDEGVGALFEENQNLPVEITDILVGPF